MAEKDSKPEEEAVAAAPEAAADGAEGEDKKAKGPKADGKKKAKKDGGKGEKGKGSGKGKGGKPTAPSGPFGHGGSGYRLNVKNFGADMTTEKLKALFEPFGNVSGAEVKTREDGKSRGFGFVIMSTEDEANKAMAEMHNKQHNGKPLNVSPAERRPQEEGEDKGKGKGKGKKGSMDAFTMQMQAFMMQQHMMAMQWYSYMGAAGMDPATGQPLAGGSGDAFTEYEGSLKSVSAKNGYGFILCGATWDIYKRDIYVDKEVLPEGAQPPDRVKFTVTLNAKGHPKAATCRPAVPKSAEKGN